MQSDIILETVYLLAVLAGAVKFGMHLERYKEQKRRGSDVAFVGYFGWSYLVLALLTAGMAWAHYMDQRVLLNVLLPLSILALLAPLANRLFAHRPRHG